MTKQEEIRVEMVTMIHTSHNEDLEKLVARILAYQESKGAALKTVTKLPDVFTIEEDYKNALEYREEIEALGLTGWEPLVKETKR